MLVFGTAKEKNKAAYEVRLLSKSNIFNRGCLIQAGVILPPAKPLEFLCIGEEEDDRSRERDCSPIEALEARRREEGTHRERWNSINCSHIEKRIQIGVKANRGSDNFLPVVDERIQKVGRGNYGSNLRADFAYQERKPLREEERCGGALRPSNVPGEQPESA
ncbi:unnamed protein product [Linum trigynum]|uniref:Uncharacterized protein n=1 Tax=Linum trigynum TaxID=586398 RepID=A0AAV2DEA4_9ROSI